MTLKIDFWTKCWALQHLLGITKVFNADPVWTAAVFTRMGVYHFRLWGAFLFWGFLGLGSNGSYSCSGIFTTAFFGFSSLAPSSVEPFPPQRTCRQQTLKDHTAGHAAMSLLVSSCIVLSPPSSWFLRFLFLHNMRRPQWATSSWEGRLPRRTPARHTVMLTLQNILSYSCSMNFGMVSSRHHVGSYVFSYKLLRLCT